MFAKRNFAAYFLAHLSGGLLIAVIVAFNMLHGYSTRFAELSYWEAVWRTFTYVLPQWTYFIVLGGGIVTILSLGAHKILANMRQWFRAYRSVNGFSMVLGLLMTLLPILFFLGSITAPFVPLILGLVIVELALLHLVEWAWKKPHPQAEKRNEASENNSSMGRNILIVNLLGAIPLAALLLAQSGLPLSSFFSMQAVSALITLNTLLLWALQSAFFMVLHGCQKSSRELVQGLLLSAGIILLSIILSFGMAYFWYWILAYMGCLLLYSIAVVNIQVRRGYFGLTKAKREPLAAY